jgi:hypothetical protein
MDWWKSWKRYINFQKGQQFSFDRPPRPGPIDNTDLIEDTQHNSIKRTCIENYDFVIVPEAVWKQLHEWFVSVSTQKEKEVCVCGSVMKEMMIVILNDNRYGGGPELPRKAIRVGYGQQLIVEIRPLKLIVSRFFIHC